jgi:putative protein-disulfide isomerase
VEPNQHPVLYHQPMPLEQRTTIAGYWRQVAEQTGAEFNFEFWEKCQPRRSTYPACRAVLAARKQDAELAMIDAIQHAYYLRAMNPSDNNVLILLAEELQLDGALFSNHLTSSEIELELLQDFALRRKLGVYSFPSLVLARGEQLTPIEINYHSLEPALAAILG